MQKTIATLTALLQRALFGISSAEIRYTISDVRKELRATRAELKAELEELRREVAKLQPQKGQAHTAKTPKAEA